MCRHRAVTQPKEAVRYVLGLEVYGLVNAGRRTTTTTTSTTTLFMNSIQTSFLLYSPQYDRRT